MIFSIQHLIVFLSFFTQCHTQQNGTKKLLFVHTMWRHGDRSPTKTFKTDPFQESDWTFGGGGWGQLSPVGMQQHFKLGQKLRNYYVDNLQFLSPIYNSKEIYIRSTDVNRTLISAYSNLLGQYSQTNLSRPGVDYPNIAGWPVGFVPIPIHTVDNPSDHLGNMESSCPLREEVWGLVKSSDQFAKHFNTSQNQQLLDTLTKNTGEPIDFDNLWIVRDSLFIEQIWKEKELKQKNSWYKDVYNATEALDRQINLWQNGIFNTNITSNGKDLSLLLRKIRGGSAVNDIMMRMNLKIRCQNSTSPDCKWINNLKNFIYSAHDTTIYAVFSALLIEDHVSKSAGLLPEYSSCLIIELYIDQADNLPYFKLLYHEKEDQKETFNVITEKIRGCEKSNDFCLLKNFQSLADEVAPDEPIDSWCQTTLTKASAYFLSIHFLIIFSFFQFL